MKIERKARVWREIIPKVSNQHNRSATISNLLGAWKKFLGEARTRILLWYVLIVTFIFVVSIPTFRLLLYTHVDTRVRRELREKMETFKSLIATGTVPYQMEIDIEDMEEFERIRADERLKPPSSRQELKDFFRAFLSRQLPEDDSYLIAFLNGKFYRSSPRGRPEPLHISEPLSTKAFRKFRKMCFFHILLVRSRASRRLTYCTKKN